MREYIWKRLGNLLSVKSLVTLVLTAVFACLALPPPPSRLSGILRT